MAPEHFSSDSAKARERGNRIHPLSNPLIAVAAVENNKGGDRSPPRVTPQGKKNLPRLSSGPRLGLTSGPRRRRLANAA